MTIDAVSDRDLLERIDSHLTQIEYSLHDIEQRMQSLEDWAKNLHAWINSTRKRIAQAAKVAGKLI